MNYDDARAKLGDRSSRKVANNTYLQQRGADIAVKLHNTDVVTFHSDGSVTLDSGGWRTHTTKDRLNSYLPPGYRVWTDKSVWYLGWNPVGQYEVMAAVPYADGITIMPDGTIYGQGEDPKAELKLRKRANKFATDYIKALRAGEVPAPGPGDCWMCLMTDKNGKTLGELSRDKDHILSHLDERYFVPSMLVRALEVMPCSNAMRWAIGEVWYPEALDGRPKCWSHSEHLWKDIKKSLARYIMRQLGLPA